jgi:hypothetical protein
MKKRFLPLLLAVFASVEAKTQCGGPITLATQADVNNFSTNYPGCTFPTGRFVIGVQPNDPNHPPVSDINDLTPLSQITGFGGNQTFVAFTSLTSLAGLDNVTDVSGDFTVQGNDLLTDLTGLGSLTHVQNLLKIQDNEGLQSLNGLAGGFTNLKSLVIIENDVLTDLGNVLDNLQTVEEYVFINTNPSLPTIGTMNNLVSIGQYLNIENHASLTSLNAFNSLVSVGGGQFPPQTKDFEVLRCPQLTTLNDFINLSELGRNFEIANNDNLEEFSFPSLTNIEGDFIFTNNDALTTLLDGFTTNFTVGNTLTITGNSSLSDCEAEAVCNHLNLDNPATITGNANGCQNVTAVETACALLPVSLTFFNGNNDGGDVLLTWQTASEENNDYFQVEHSTDGSNFQPIGKVGGRGTSTASHNYSLRHTRPAKGSNYYRLKQVDFDGQFAYSPIVHVEIRGGLLVEAFPNPTTGYVRLKGELSEGTARMTDVNGVTLHEKQLPDERNFDLTYLPTGIYFLEIVMGNEKIVKRVVKE